MDSSPPPLLAVGRSAYRNLSPRFESGLFNIPVDSENHGFVGLTCGFSPPIAANVLSSVEKNSVIVLAKVDDFLSLEADLFRVSTCFRDVFSCGERLDLYHKTLVHALEERFLSSTDPEEYLPTCKHVINRFASLWKNAVVEIDLQEDDCATRMWFGRACPSLPLSGTTLTRKFDNTKPEVLLVLQQLNETRKEPLETDDGDFEEEQSLRHASVDSLLFYASAHEQHDSNPYSRTPFNEPFNPQRPCFSHALMFTPLLLNTSGSVRTASATLETLGSVLANAILDRSVCTEGIQDYIRSLPPGIESVLSLFDPLIIILHRSREGIVRRLQTGTFPKVVDPQSAIRLASTKYGYF